MKTIEDDAFYGLSKVVYVGLFDNRLTTLRANIFKHLTQLAGLDISWNRLNIIESNAFVDLVNLDAIGLDNNQISSLRAGMFNGLGKLQKLYATNNDISSIQDKTFDGLSSISHIMLEKNKLKHFDFAMFNPDDFTNGHPDSLEVSLHHNPIVCDSRLCWLRDAEVDGWLYWFQWRGTYYYLKCSNFNDAKWQDKKDDITCEGTIF